MAILVVGGSGKGVGKTALVCGLITALPEFHWSAVKITSHTHTGNAAICEETTAGQGTDTARYLAAGAELALLVSASDEELPEMVKRLFKAYDSQRNWIIESNRILQHLRPDLCLAVVSDTAPKTSFRYVRDHLDASVMIAERDAVIPGEKPNFQLHNVEKISPEMSAWMRLRLKG